MNGLPNNSACQGNGMHPHTQAKALSNFVEQINNGTGANKFKAKSISLNECSAFSFKGRTSQDHDRGSNFFACIFSINKKYSPTKSTVRLSNRINVVGEATNAVLFCGFHSYLSYLEHNLSTLCNFLGARYSLFDVPHGFVVTGGPT